MNQPLPPPPPPNGSGAPPPPPFGGGFGGPSGPPTGGMPMGMFGADVNAPVYWLQSYGAGNALVSVAQLQQMARAGAIQPSTMVQHKDASFPVPVSSLPDVYSNRSYIAALLISWFLGVLGIDRFYLGYTGLGIAKLLTLGGCGVWALIDLVLIAMRKVPDSDGRPLS